MGFWSVLLIALALSMDALAVSIAAGCRMHKATWVGAARPGLWFGGFQLLMPILGWTGGVGLSGIIDDLGPWIAFALLSFIGAKMIVESSSPQNAEENGKLTGPISTRDMAFLAIATSIDALAVGLSFSMLHIAIWWPAFVIGVTTFTLCTAGTFVGCRIGRTIKGKAGMFGGIILVGIGIRILAQQLH